MSNDVFYFGVWNTPESIALKAARAGHYWHGPGGVYVPSDNPALRHVAHAFDWIDGGYAPREWRGDRIIHRKLVNDPSCCWITEGKTREDRQRIQWDTNEFPQGTYLVHYKTVLPTAEVWSLMSWWDRTQGDGRGACNSNIVARGQLAGDDLFELLCDHFSTVAANLARAGIVVREAALK